MTSLPSYPHRDLRTRENPQAIADLLQTIFAGELLCPSTQLWLVSPWISDIPILDNTAGQFSSLVPEFDRAPVRLSKVLQTLAERQSQVFIAVREAEHNRAFVSVMRDIERGLANRIIIQQARDIHEKGLLGDAFYLSGSFNFTFGGISVNEEVAHLFTDPAVIAENRMAFVRRWSGGEL